MAALAVSDNPDRQRFEITSDGEPGGFAAYRRRPGLIAFMHTEIEERFEGQGLGSRLVHDALEEARAQQLDVLPFCPFVNGLRAAAPGVRGAGAGRAAGSVRALKAYTASNTGASSCTTRRAWTPSGSSAGLKSATETPISPGAAASGPASSRSSPQSRPSGCG